MNPNFSNVFDEFEQQGYCEDSYMREIDLLRVLDDCSRKNAKIQKFDREIATQLWENTVKNQEGDCVLLKDYVETICTAQDILREKIRRAQDKYSAEMNEDIRRNLMVNIYSLSQDEKMVTAPFKINDDLASNLIKLSRHSISPSDRTMTSIFADEIDLQRKVSKALTLVVYLAFIALILQLITINSKMGFFGLFTILTVLSIFLLNYFDRAYIQFVFLCLIISIVADSAWLAMKIQDYWNPEQSTWNRSQGVGFLRFVVVVTIIIAAIKLLMALALFKYRSAPHGLKKKANFFILEFNLDANPVVNPVTATIKKIFPKFLIS